MKTAGKVFLGLFGIVLIFAAIFLPIYFIYFHDSCIYGEQKNDQGECVPICIPGQYYYNDVCGSCPPGYGHTEASCEPCGEKEYSYNNVCYSTCPTGTKISSNTCAKICPKNEYYLDGECVTTCPAGYIPDTQKLTCQACASGLTYKGACVTTCPNGTIPPPEEVGDCQSCPTGTFSWQGECVITCPAGTYPNELGGCETYCIQGYANLNRETDMLQCVITCPEDRIIDEACSNCPLGQLEYKDMNGDYQCVDQCTEGYYEATSLLCCLDEEIYIDGACRVQCPAGEYYPDPTNVFCETCPTSKPNTYNNTCYDQCPYGLVAQDNACVSECLKGYVEEDGVCEPLCTKEGQVYTNNGITAGCIDIANCPYPDENIYDLVCAPCPQGEVLYNNLCLPTCPAGTVLSADGLVCVPNYPVVIFMGIETPNASTTVSMTMGGQTVTHVMNTSPVPFNFPSGGIQSPIRVVVSGSLTNGNIVILLGSVPDSVFLIEGTENGRTISNTGTYTVQAVGEVQNNFIQSSTVAFTDTFFSCKNTTVLNECVLPFGEAVTTCDSDPNCGGITETDFDSGQFYLLSRTLGYTSSTISVISYIKQPDIRPWIYLLIPGFAPRRPLTCSEYTSGTCIVNYDIARNLCDNDPNCKGLAQAVRDETWMDTYNNSLELFTRIPGNPFSDDFAANPAWSLLVKIPCEEVVGRPCTVEDTYFEYLGRKKPSVLSGGPFTQFNDAINACAGTCVYIAFDVNNRMYYLSDTEGLEEGDSPGWITMVPLV